MNAIVNKGENPSAMVFNVIATYAGTVKELQISQYRTDTKPVYYLRINAKYMGVSYIIPIRGITYYTRNGNWKMLFPDKADSFDSETIVYLYWHNDGYAYVYCSDGTPSDVIDSFEIGTLS